MAGAGHQGWAHRMPESASSRVEGHAVLKLLLIIALVVVVIMFVIPAMRRRS